MKVVVKIKFNVPYTQFSNPFVEARLTEKWIEHRLAIFMKYTYVSLVRQTNQAFRAFVLYDSVSEGILKEKLKKYGSLNPNVVFTDNFKESMANYIQDEDYFCLHYLDSDNMIHPSYIQRLYDTSLQNTEVIITTSGYVYEEDSGRLSLYAHATPDTFYTLIYETKPYLEGFRYDYPCNQYEDVTIGQFLLKLKYKIFSERLFLITIHDKNISHNIEHMFGYKTVHGFLQDGEERRRVLKDYQLDKYNHKVESI
ncbi:MAG: glycosyltransferase [Cellulosilyticaceae bacterium]